MKIKASGIDGFVRRPDPAVRVVLVYGPDGGRVREVAANLTKSVAEDPTDPFRVTELTGKQVADDPAVLADEAAAISMTGGRRVVRIGDVTNDLAKPIEAFCKAPVGDALIVIIGGDLPAKSSLRAVCEKADNAAALPCYVDEGRGLDAVIRETLKARGVDVDREAMTFLLQHLGADRQVTRSELDKLATYMGGNGTVGLADAALMVGDSTALSIDDLAFAVADGDISGSQALLDRLFGEGVASVTLLRAMSRHFQRLHLAAGHMSSGANVDQAINALKPKPFFKVADRFKRQLQHWPPGRLATALGLLTDAEADCKSTGMPDRDIVGRVTLQIARAAGARRRR